MLLVALLFMLAWFTTHYLGALVWYRLYQLNFHQEEEYIPLGLSNILGMAALGLMLGIIHFFSSISWIMMFAILVIALNDRQQTTKYLSQSWQQIKPHLIWLIPAILFSWIAILLRPGVGDIADYHLQDILWAEHYPMVKGLGNFNRPLANNNWWFNLQAAFGLNQITKASIYVGNALIFISTLCWFVISPCQNKQHQWFRIVFIAFIILSLKTAFVGAVTSDFIVTLSLYVLIDLFLIGSINPNQKHWTQLYMFILVCFMVTVKATALTFFMLPLPWLLNLLKERKFQFLFKLIGIALLFFVPYLIGNVLLSGYLLYPFNQLDFFSFDWEVPGYYFELDKIILSNWAKIPGQDVYETAKLGFVQWFPIWLNNLDFINKALFTSFIAAAPLVLINSISTKEIRWIFAFLLLGYFTIFLNGPHPRFLFSYMVGIIALAIYTFPIRFNPKKVKQILWLLLLGIGTLQSFKLFQTQSPSSFLLEAKPYPKNNLEEREINGFKFLYSPLNNTLWDQFPASYYMIDSVTLRTNNVKDGFKIKSSNP